MNMLIYGRIVDKFLPRSRINFMSMPSEGFGVAMTRYIIFALR